MAEAYCPYCGEQIERRGQSHCPHCGENIIDIWKLLNSGLPVPSPRRTVPPLPPLLWLARFIFAGMLLVLLVIVVYFLYIRILELDLLKASGAWISALIAAVPGFQVQLGAAPAPLAGLICCPLCGCHPASSAGRQA